jgi:hypothetical protein
MRKVLAWSLLVTFSWLQIYQVCDASEDTMEAVTGRLESLSQKGPILHSPAAPDNDPDVNLPFVGGEVLSHSRIQPALGLTVSQVIPLFALHPEVPLLVASAQVLSPPGWGLSAESPPVSSLLLDRSPAHSLAPPLA